MCQLRHADKNSFSRNLKVASKPHQFLNDDWLLAQIQETSKRHYQFGSSDIAQHFKLPFIGSWHVLASAGSNFFCTVGEKRVRYLMSNRKTNSFRRLLRIVFYDNLIRPTRNGSRINYLYLRLNANAYQVRQPDRVGSRPSPNLVHC